MWSKGGGEKPRKEEKRGFYYNRITTIGVVDKKCMPRLIWTGCGEKSSKSEVVG